LSNIRGSSSNYALPDQTAFSQTQAGATISFEVHETTAISPELNVDSALLNSLVQQMF
jgi:hypothetical protein